MAFEGKPEAALTYALRNGSLQGAYFMLAARALGLDVGAMSGFDNAGVDKEFFRRHGRQIELFCAMWVSAIRPRCVRAVRALLSTRLRT
jgi:nitroreductase